MTLLMFVFSKTTEPRKLKNIDRKTGMSMEVTVNGVTVVVTDYKPKPASSTSKSRLSNESHSSHDSSASSPNGTPRVQPHASTSDSNNTNTNVKCENDKAHTD